jgi:hypothetical protein
MKNYEDFYTSSVLRKPFKFKLFTDGYNGKIVKTASARKLLKNETLLEKSLKRLDHLGITKYIDIDVEDMHISNGIYLTVDKSFSVKLLNKTVAPAHIGVYDIIARRVFLEDGSTTDLVLPFYQSIYSRNKAFKLNSKYFMEGMPLKHFANYMTFMYDYYRNQALEHDVSIEYTSEIFIKTLAMEKIQKAIGFNLPNVILVQHSLANNNSPKQVTLLNGELKDWLPYLKEDIRLENLAYLFLQTVYDEAGFDRGDKVNAIAKAFLLKKEYSYAPLEIRESGNLPLMWFKKLYTNSNLDESMLPHL